MRSCYPVEKVIGIADLLVYHPTNKTQRILSTPNRPSGPLLEEKGKGISAQQAELFQSTKVLQSTNNVQESTTQRKKTVLSTPELPSGTSLEERNQSISSRVSGQLNIQPSGNILLREDKFNQSPRPSTLFSEGTDRRFVITDNFHHDNAPVFERLGTRPAQPAPGLNARETKQAKTKQSKPPNHSRINYTLKLVRPSVKFSARSTPAQLKVSYSEIAKDPASIMRAPTAITNSTLKSTTNMPRPATNEPGGTASKEVNQDPKVPFKLIPLMPPKKSNTINNLPTAANPSNLIKTVPKKVVSTKSKLKSVVQRRSLPPVQEDMQVESTTDISNNKRVMHPTTFTINRF